jgi:MOSC domain-containing protein YiiM
VAGEDGRVADETAPVADRTRVPDGPARVTAVCVVSQILPDDFGEVATTAIDKRPVDARVEVRPSGLVGDTQCDTANHGGTYQAVYAYADEDAAWWAGELGRPVPPGLFGENLRTSGLDVTGAEIGETWRIGDGEGALVVAVTQPRIPCRTFQQRMAEPAWVRRFTEHGAPGAYLRVLTPGSMAAGDPVTVVHRPGHGVTIGDAFLRPDPAVMRRLLRAGDGGVVDLAPGMRAHAERAAIRA